MAKIDARLAGSQVLWREAQAKVAMLTPRQIDVLTLLAEGHSNKSIGRVLGISERTVEIHRGHLTTKLGARTAGDLARAAVYAALADVISDEAEPSPASLAAP